MQVQIIQKLQKMKVQFFGLFQLPNFIQHIPVHSFIYTANSTHREVVFIIEKNLQTTRIDSWVYSFKQTSI